MNRRDFCKLAFSSGLMAAIAPSRAIASVIADDVNLHITVVRCECYSDLQSCFGSDPEAGVCPMLRPGMSWDVSSLSCMPAGMCPKAWHVIKTSLDASNQQCRLSKNVMLVSCPDGSRPVVFKVQS